MDRFAKVLVAAAAALVVAGTIASASPSLRSGATGTPSPADPTEVSGPTGDPEELTGPTGDPTGPTAETGETGVVAAVAPTDPDFSDCDDLTGLQNAICRHVVLLAVDPENAGLLNSCTHLMGNYGRQHGTEVDATTCVVPTDVTETESGDGTDQSGDVTDESDGASDHGQSGQEHGNDGSHGQASLDHGNGGGNGQDDGGSESD